MHVLNPSVKIPSPVPSVIFDRFPQPYIMAILIVLTDVIFSTNVLLKPIILLASF